MNIVIEYARANYIANVMKIWLHVEATKTTNSNMVNGGALY